MILLTGGAGFLGRHVLDRLSTQDRPVRLLCRSEPKDLPTRSSVQIVRGDITVASSLPTALAGVEWVIHVAGLVDFNPDADGRRRLLEVNEQGTRNLMEAAVAAKVRRVVHVSSVSAIGAAPDFEHPLCEDDFGNGQGINLPYPQSKLRGETVALEFVQRGLEVVVVNPTFFAGPGDLNLSSARTILSFLKRQVWVGLSCGGMGYTDVRDVAAGVVAALERGRSGRRYILGGHNLRIREYHRLLAKITGLRPPLVLLPPAAALVVAKLGLAGYRALGIKTYVAPGDIHLAKHYWVYRYDRSRNELGLVCRSPEESLSDAIAWLRHIGLENF